MMSPAEHRQLLADVDARFVANKVVEVVAAACQEARHKRVEAKRKAIEDLIYEIREHTYTGYYGWSFDMDMDAAIARVRQFIEESP